MPWSTLFWIVREADERIVGACGFQAAPVQGLVEVAYGVAPSARGQGAATEALRSLVALAFRAGARQVVADVAPENLASVRVVQKAAFVEAGDRPDSDGEPLRRWVRARRG